MPLLSLSFIVPTSVAQSANVEAYKIYLIAPQSMNAFAPIDWTCSEIWMYFSAEQLSNAFSPIAGTLTFPVFVPSISFLTA